MEFINAVETVKVKEYLRQINYMKTLGAQYALTANFLTLRLFGKTGKPKYS